MVDHQQEIRKHLVALLIGGDAHATLEEAVAHLPTKLRHQRPENIPYTIWELLEHIRIAQYDIVAFSCNPEYISPEWPEGYWPDEEKIPTEEMWQSCLANIKADRKAMIDLISNKENDLLTPIPHGNGQTLFREAMLLADHNAYHTGQIILVRRLLGNWKE